MHTSDGRFERRMGFSFCLPYGLPLYRVPQPTKSSDCYGTPGFIILGLINSCGGPPDFIDTSSTCVKAFPCSVCLLVLAHRLSQVVLSRLPCWFVSCLGTLFWVGLK